MKTALIIGIALGIILMGSGPKKDKRFKTGYKNNKTPDMKVNLAGLALAVVCGALFNFLY